MQFCGPTTWANGRYRRFTIRDFQRSLGAVFSIPQDYSLTNYLAPDELRRFNVNETRWGLSDASVFVLKKEDCHLMARPIASLTPA